MMSTYWDEMSDGQKASFPVAGPEHSKGGFIPGLGVPIKVAPLQPKQPGDVDDVIIDARTMEVRGHVRWNADGTMSRRAKPMDDASS